MPLIAIPIRTETVIRRTPAVNYALIAVNALLLLVLQAGFTEESALVQWQQSLALRAQEPAWHQFFTYQFVHADLKHLIGNMLCLWVFGNSVNAKMGHGPYLMFYLAGGVFAGWAHALLHPNPLVGASGAVAAVTTAYLVLFPRSYVTVLVWFLVFIHFFEVPAMLVIGLKIVVWDNIIGPGFAPSQGVAYHAHLAGYLFGFVGALGMLLVRALPRDQFDILAVWRRWNQRRGASMATAGVGGPYGAMGRPAPIDPQQRALEERRLDEFGELRSRIAAEIERGAVPAAAAWYEQLIARGPEQCMSEHQQLAIGREFYGNGRFPQAAAAFDRFVECYPNSSEAGNVRLLLGIIYARDLRQYEVADRHLTRSMEDLRDAGRRDQCLQWLRNVRAALGRPAPESLNG